MTVINVRKPTPFLLFLGVAWLLFHFFDVVVTLVAIESGTAYEANKLMAPLVHNCPVAAIIIKMLMAYSVLKIIEFIEHKTLFSPLPILLVADMGMLAVCLHNMRVVLPGW
ncbi:MAG: hypothetical protein IT210_05790 [Armatimonadetes bacterium]|nr:hypothetical protein [Armatimonadota bacterium]